MVFLALNVAVAAIANDGKIDVGADFFRDLKYKTVEERKFIFGENPDYSMRVPAGDLKHDGGTLRVLDKVKLPVDVRHRTYLINTIWHQNDAPRLIGYRGEKDKGKSFVSDSFCFIEKTIDDVQAEFILDGNLDDARKILPHGFYTSGGSAHFSMAGIYGLEASKTPIMFP